MHKNVTTLKAVISSCAMPAFGKSHSLPPAACLSNAKLPFLSWVPGDPRRVIKTWQFSAQKSNVPVKSWIPNGEMGRDLLRQLMWQVAGNSVSPLQRRGTEGSRWGISSYVLSRREPERSVWGFMPFFPLQAKKWVAKLLREEGCFVSFPPAPALGRSRKGWSFRTDGPLAVTAVSNAQLSHKFPSWFQRSLKTVMDVCAIGKTLHWVHSVLQPPGTQVQTRQKQCHQQREEKHFKLSMYLYTHTYIPPHY